MGWQDVPSRFRHDRRGSIAIMSALLAVVLLGIAAFAIDAGQLYYAKRRLQTATDIAAIAAASDRAQAQNAAAANVLANGFPVSALQSVEIGTYMADPTLPVTSRFAAGGTAPNAVRVTTLDTEPMMFGHVIVPGSGNIAIRAQAIGMSGDVAAFSLGSRLAQLNGGVANAVLGSMLGTSLSLSVADYRALLDAKVDLFGFSDAVAAKIGLTGNATYGMLAARSLQVSDIMAALSNASSVGGGSAAASSALRAVISALGASPGNSVLFGKLVDFGPFSPRQIGSGAPIATQVSVLDLLYAAAEIGSAGHLLQTSVAANIPGLLDVQLAISIGEPAVGSSLVGLGASGATVHTAQIRILATVKLAGSGLLATVTVPFYIEAAQATGQVQAISCPNGNPGADEVDLGITPGIADAWIGNVSMSDFQSMSTPPSPGAATLLNIAGLVSVTGRAHATISNTTATIVPFSAADIAAGTVKTTSTTDYLSPLVSNLVSSLQLNVNIVGLGIGVPPGLDRSVLALITSDLPAIDQLLSSTLATFGVTLGDADSSVAGLRCGQGFLAN